MSEVFLIQAMIASIGAWIFLLFAIPARGSDEVKTLKLSGAFAGLTVALAILAIAARFA